MCSLGLDNAETRRLENKTAMAGSVVGITVKIVEYGKRQDGHSTLAAGEIEKILRRKHQSGSMSNNAALLDSELSTRSA